MPGMNLIYYTSRRERGLTRGQTTAPVLGTAPKISTTHRLSRFLIFTLTKLLRNGSWLIEKSGQKVKELIFARPYLSTFRVILEPYHN